MKIKLIYCTIVFLFSIQSVSAITSLPNTQIKLQEIEVKIARLQKTLNTSQDKQKIFHQELDHIHKRIASTQHLLAVSKNKLSDNRKIIQKLQKQVEQTSAILSNQQQQLARYLRARYQMDTSQPVKWLFNQDGPQTMDRLLTFYQYLIQFQKNSIYAIRESQTLLKRQEERLQLELRQQQQLQQQLTKQQQQLEHDTLFHQKLIHELGNHIRHTEQSLTQEQINKENLSKLLKTLVQKSAKTYGTFHNLHYKLLRPVQSKNHAFQSMHQGVTFFAQEGAPVLAAQQGKVVFSDWLNGYGLLLIIDHGQGLMTLYGYNQSLLKSKGNFVNQGDKIALVGHTGGLQQNGLYFELRQRGKAISPMKWLS